MVIATKILVFFLVFAILNVIREAFSFFMAFLTDSKYGFTTRRLFLLGVSLSYIFTIIFTGFSLV